MEKYQVKIAFESRNIEVTNNLMSNILEFAIRSMYGLIGGSLLNYEILSIEAENSMMCFQCDKGDSEKIIGALAMVGSYGVSRIKTAVKKISCPD
ncbi:hypothetical protein SteCoe_18373 [Stentor coeruleus]|uniref:Uncharacterized protein n=1 Tax=Stentor coeruleus TaxID=5963 RepID=A0A1R2BX25_9CILI|nr:hypothetical protein SteCoe_18373 [Stentor coeruleus]